ncbi:unnamed protein product [Nezara viridula]|uniref:Uncharacterized protein n=1 Tax=Nezara viridula TaxID=85310 RepID=A0A9P0MZ54_NEZVI|nr:unnamed protein product [Nezara viridula]
MYVLPGAEINAADPQMEERRKWRESKKRMVLSALNPVAFHRLLHLRWYDTLVTSEASCAALQVIALLTYELLAPCSSDPKYASICMPRKPVRTPPRSTTGSLLLVAGAKDEPVPSRFGEQHLFTWSGSDLAERPSEAILVTISQAPPIVSSRDNNHDPLTRSRRSRMERM